ncbi:cyclin-SDS-like [Syzygium oleosum]|uniref:cyclin-SDS-like n=1 Tax=Syzygium oleosum TaxID=219896 RepID=UPI0024BA15FF|nr:cyclin-SDS-like [Syzygium oleosum]
MKPPPPPIRRMLRSKLPQRRRSQFSPLPCFSRDSTISASVDSSYLDGEASVGSTRKRRSDAAAGGGDCELRRAARPSCRRRAEGEGGAAGAVAEASVSETCSGSSFEVDSREESSELKDTGACRGLEEFRENAASESIARSEISCVHQHEPATSGELSSELSRNRNAENEVVSRPSFVDLCSKATSGFRFAELEDDTLAVECHENRASSEIFSETSKDHVAGCLPASKSESTVDQKPSYINYDADLACTEQIPYDGISDYSSDLDLDSFSELQKELFEENSDEYSSEYILSISSESGPEFSEKSDEDSNPSPTFSLLIQYREQFLRSSTRSDNRKAWSLISQVNHGCGDEEDAESYQLLRNRERREVFLRNYVEEYGEPVLKERTRMVHWIIEQSTARELHNETLFLGVSLFDRFFSKGYFKQRRNFQIAGIACLTLATRIEENQPYNSVRQKNFRVGSDNYSRCEVVAMEWLVLEVLNFQCALPTMHNFLWFYSRAARADARVNKRAINLAALALLDHEQLSYWPSTVAAALVILASVEDASCKRVMQTHLGTEGDDIVRCIESLQWVAKYIAEVAD